jgi:hypothetical protein
MAQTQHYEPTASPSNAWAGWVGFVAVGWSEARAAM